MNFDHFYRLPANSSKLKCYTSYQETLNSFASDTSSDIEQVVFKIGEETWSAEARIVNRLSKAFAERYRNEKSIVWNVPAREKIFEEFRKFFTSTHVTIKLKNAIELYELAHHFQIHDDAMHCIVGFIIANLSQLNALLIHDIARQHNDYYMLLNTSAHLGTNVSTNNFIVPEKIFSFDPATNNLAETSVDDRSYIKFNINTPGYLVGVEFVAFEEEELPYDLEYRIRLCSEEKVYTILHECTVKHYRKHGNATIYVLFKEAIYIGAGHAYSIELTCDEHSFGFSTGIMPRLFQINGVLDEDGVKFTCISADSHLYFYTKFSKLYFYPVLLQPNVEIAQRDEL